MPRVFVSYATANQGFAGLAEMMLKEAGYEVWLAHRQLDVGEEWRIGIDNGIASSDVLLLVVTPQSCESKYVTYEWAFALGKSLKVIPLVLEKAEMHPRLAVLQHLDFTNKKAMPWDKLFHEIDKVTVKSDSQKYEGNILGMTVDQVQGVISGVVSLANAALKSFGESPAAEQISRATQNIVDVLQHSDHFSGSPVTGREKHILWVDDRPKNNINERRAFESVGIKITLALSTQEALQKMSEQHFDTIISDMGRKEGPREGYVLLDVIRSQGDQTPLFFYASSKAPEHGRETVQHGGQGCTNDPQELFQMVMTAIINSLPR